MIERLVSSCLSSFASSSLKWCFPQRVKHGRWTKDTYSEQVSSSHTGMVRTSRWLLLAGLGKIEGIPCYCSNTKTEHKRRNKLRLLCVFG